MISFAVGRYHSDSSVENGSGQKMLSAGERGCKGVCVVDKEGGLQF